MYETPTLDIQELRSVLTDAGHTAVGFATMAVKKANDVRLDLSDRYEEQTKDFRSNLLTVVERFADVRTKVEARVDPVLETITDRLPAPARKVVENLTDSVKGAQDKAHQFVVSALTVEAPKAVANVKSAKASPAKPATKKVVTKVVKKVAAANVVAKKVVVKKSAAAKASVKPSAKKPAARKTVARKAA